MSQPLFKLQIVDLAGHPVTSPFTAGRLECDLIDACAKAIVARGVGLLRSTAHVEADIRAGMVAAIQALKDDTRFVALHQFRR